MRLIASRRVGIFALFFVLLIVSSAPHLVLAQGKGNGGGKGGGPGKDDGGDGGDGGEVLPLPPVQYRVSFVELPAGSGIPWVNDVNDLGQAVGRIELEGRSNAVVYDAVSGTTRLLEDLVDPSTIPFGLYLGSAVGINNHGVVVGYLSGEGKRQPYAVDLGMDNPVVDLLPTPAGMEAYARRINDNGDIVGPYMVEEASGPWAAVYSVWHMNPRLYGHPESRAVRDGNNDGLPDERPLDLTQADHKALFDEVGELYSHVEINEPDFVNAIPAQIIVNTRTVAVRYTLSDPIIDPDQAVSPRAEWFPEIDHTYSAAGINSKGVWLGRSAVYTSKRNKTEVVNHLYGSVIGVLPADPYVFYPAGIQENDHAVFANGMIYGDWNDGHGSRAVHLDDLAVGTESALATWLAFPNVQCDSVSGLGVIVGKLRNEDNTLGPLFFAVEEQIEPTP